MISREGLSLFFIEEQNERLTEDELNELMSEFSEEFQGQQFITRSAFYYIMETPKWSELFDYDQREICQDMTRPMTDYFIASSHNSYLSGNQLSSESSYEMYRKILLTGCRCIEIDLWDDVGNGGLGTTRPVIYHGYTLTTKIELQGVLETINSVAFEKSDYPLIISIENRCKQTENHRCIANLMHAIFKDRLYIEPISDDCLRFPSPEQMRGKIFIKCSKNQSLNKHFLSETDFDRRLPLGIMDIYLVSGDRRRDHLEQIQQQKYSKRERHEPVVIIKNDVEEDDDNFYLIMEYIDGPTLSEYIHSHGPLNIETAIDFIKQILNGVKQAHEQRIIHRDIKPQNVLINKDKILKIFDFGIAKALSETSMTQTNHVLGTVQYLSPEQAKGDKTNETTDIYSIGIVLYEMLVGEPPFRGETAVSIAIKHIQETVPNITEKHPNIPQSLSNVVLKATEKNPKDRYQTIEEMYNDLSSVLVTSRLNEEKHTRISDTTQTVPIDKKEIKNKTEKKNPFAKYLKF